VFNNGTIGATGITTISTPTLVNNAPTGYIGNLVNSTTVATPPTNGTSTTGCAIYSGTGVLQGAPLTGVPCGEGLAGSISQALASLNSTITSSEITTAILNVVFTQQAASNEGSLPSSEGSTGRGDSASIPTNGNSEIHTPVGKNTSTGFTPITTGGESNLIRIVEVETPARPE
jgi:hypothetical protein